MPLPGSSASLASRFHIWRRIVIALLLGAALTLCTTWLVPLFERHSQIPGPNQGAVIRTAIGRQGSWGIETHYALCSTFIVVRPVDMHIRPLEGVDAFAKLREMAPHWARTPIDTVRPFDVTSFAAGWPFRALACELWGATNSASPTLEWGVRMDPAKGGPVILPYRPIPLGLIGDWAFWSLLAAAILWCLHSLKRNWRLRWGHCPDCKYDLSGQTSRGCPECGWHRTPDPAASLRPTP